jgi:branched-chain amino acid transport system substrate-binding protein
MSTNSRRLAAALLTLGLLTAACGRSDDSSGGGGGGGGGDDTTPSVTNTSGEAVEAVATTDDCEDYDGTAGVEDGTIHIGSSLPTGLPFNNIALGAQAYFAMRNAEDPIAEHQVELTVLDDAYTATETKKNWDTLTQEENVFATLLVVGTQNNLTFREDNNIECIPNIFAATGSEFWGEPGEFPWTIGSIPAYPTESAVFAEWLKANKPDAKVAILYQDDDFGESYRSSFNAAIEGTEIEVVGEESYPRENPNVKSQITTLKGTGADTILIGTTLTACSGALNEIAELDWEPVRYLSATCASPVLMGASRSSGASVGALTSLYLKAPDDPAWAEDADMIAFKEKGMEYGLTEAQANDGLTVYGWTMADLFAQAVEAAPAVERAAVMNALWSMEGLTSPLLLPGITVNTAGADDPFPIEALSIGVEDGSVFVLEDELLDFEGETGNFVG